MIVAESDSYYIGGRREPPAVDGSADVPASSPPVAPPQDDWEAADLSVLSLARLEQLIAHAEAGDPSAIAAFQEFLANDGSAAWREVGDLAGNVEKVLLASLFAGKKGPALAARRRFQELREQLSEAAEPLERLAQERVLLAVLFATAVDFLIAAEGPGGLANEKRLRAQQLAEKRVSAALKSLQTAREICRVAAAKPLRLFSSGERRATG